ncbi:MAG: hypothetical protein ACE5DL_03370, partial [Nitrosopumilaceae archaeon]
VIGDNDFVTTTLPVNFLAQPYQVYVEEEKIRFHQSFKNETHVSLNIRPEQSGDVLIAGTVVPEIKISTEESIELEIIIVSVIIVGAVVAGIIFYKRKK